MTSHIHKLTARCSTCNGSGLGAVAEALALGLPEGAVAHSLCETCMGEGELGPGHPLGMKAKRTAGAPQIPEDWLPPRRPPLRAR